MLWVTFSQYDFSYLSVWIEEGVVLWLFQTPLEMGFRCLKLSCVQQYDVAAVGKLNSDLEWVTVSRWWEVAGIWVLPRNSFILKNSKKPCSKIHRVDSASRQPADRIPFPGERPVYPSHHGEFWKLVVVTTLVYPWMENIMHPTNLKRLSERCEDSRNHWLHSIQYKPKRLKEAEPHSISSFRTDWLVVCLPGLTSFL